MTFRDIVAVALWLAVPTLALGVPPVGPRPPQQGRPQFVRDALWVWGNPEMAKPGSHTLATFASATPAERAQLLGVPNVVMAGLGLPSDDAKAEALTKAVAKSPRLVWEIASDEQGPAAKFVYNDTIARVRRLAERHPGIEGILLDDMSSVQIDHGFKPEHIRGIRELLGPTNERVKIWGVLYTMNLDRPGIADYVKQLDVINLWTWHAKDVLYLDRNVARCEAMFPKLPIVLGLYLYDYGGGRRMPLNLLEAQCGTALKLVRSRRVKGIVFLTINDDADAVGWAARWVQRVGNQLVGATP